MSRSSISATKWTCSRYAELDPLLIHEIFKLRVDVFVVEQACAYAELDGRDPEALHIIGRDEKGDLLAYARILPPEHGSTPHVGRVVVPLFARGSGLGHQLMEHVLKALREHYGNTDSQLAAQDHLRRFYASFGYRAIGEVYPWDGIPHVDMVLTGPR